MELIQKFDSRFIDDAIKKGVSYLLSRNENGRWKGFPTLAGESDIWVTAFVLTHIINQCEQTNTISESQKFLLQSQLPAGGWSYSSHVPADADSTAWCLQALESCKDFTEVDAEKAKTFLWNHLTGKGISTYKTNSGIREFISATADEFIAGWTSAHPDVSIAAVLADLHNEKVPEILNWLIEQQENTGFIHSYWWRGPHYATTLLLRAFTKLKLRLPQEREAMITDSLVGEQLADGGFGLDSSATQNPFTTALALESFTHLSYLGFDGERNLCGNVLLLSQNQNGSWAGDYILRIPAPFVIDPNEVASWNNTDGGGNSLINDQDGLFATTMACYALACWRNTVRKDMKAPEIKTNII